MAVNDGAAVAEQLSRYWDLLRAEAVALRADAEEAEPIYDRAMVVAS